MSLIGKLALATAATASVGALANPIRVTPDNFPEAETTGQMAKVIARGGMGRFAPLRNLVTPDQNVVVRPNRDTLYSTALFDLDAGPVTVHLPDAGKRYMSLMVINGGHYVPAVHHGGGTYVIDRATAGTRYVIAGVRIFVDPTRAGDLEEVHRLQDAITVDQPGGPGSFDPTDWDAPSQQQVRDALLTLGATLPNLDQAFGKSGEVDPVAHLIGAAMAWGGLPRTESIYENIIPERNDGTTTYRLIVGAVPVDAFWSITIYDTDGKLIPNTANLYSLNSATTRRSADGTATIQFGNCAQRQVNCLPTAPGWNYMVRLYRPRAEILDGSWRFPEAVPAAD